MIGGFLNDIRMRDLGSSRRLLNSYFRASGFVPAPMSSGVMVAGWIRAVLYIPAVRFFSSLKRFSLIVCLLSFFS
jgi:hypothetical protein